MTKKTLQDDSVDKLIKLSESPAMKLAREFANSPTMQIIQRMKQNNDLERIVTSVQQVNLAFDTLAGSPLWVELSDTIKNLNDAFIAYEQIAAGMKKTVFAVEQAMIPTAHVLRAFAESVNLDVQLLSGHFKSLAEWQSSLAKRMSAITVPWALEKHLGVSTVGFARIARLHDLAVGAQAFEREPSGIFGEELGTPVPYDEAVGDRDVAALNAGFNPEVITFPSETYPQILITAGFSFRMERLPSLVSDTGDDSGVFDFRFNALFTQIEHRLRDLIVQELKCLVGKKWYKRRIPEQLRNKWEERRNNDRLDRMDCYSLILYADFMDISEIICRNDNWKDVFQRFFSSKPDFQISMQRLHPIRKALGHSRPLVRSDQLILFCEATRILKAIGIKEI